MRKKSRGKAPGKQGKDKPPRKMEFDVYAKNTEQFGGALHQLKVNF